MSWNSATLPGSAMASAPRGFTLGRLRAERLERSHLGDLRRMDGNVRMMATLGGVRTEAETEAYLERNLSHWDRYGFGLWILRDLGTVQVIGRAGLRHIEVEGTPEVELSYALLPKFWGRGLATDAARACVTVAREWIGLPSVVALTLPANLASQSVLRHAELMLEREVIHGGQPHLLFRSN